MKVIVFPLLYSNSKRAFLRKTKSFGRPYQYFPRMALLKRLRKELGMTNEQILDQVDKEREFYIKILYGG